MSEGERTALVSGLRRQDQQDHRSLIRLYCMNGGHHLRILPDGSVSGGRLDHDIYDVLRVKAVSAGVVVIKGEATGRYLAMHQDGHLYGSPVVNEDCYVLEKYEENHYNSYRSQRQGWYFGLKKNGQPKAGASAQRHQKAVFFLPRPVGHL